MTRILTGTEVADLLAVDVGTVKAMTVRGELPALVRVADELLISEGALREFIHGAWVADPWEGLP